MNPKTLTVKRETLDVWSVKSNYPYWSDGQPISARVAFDARGKLSAIRAQAIDRENGISYLLVSPISFSNAAVLAAAGGLRIGESEVVAL